MNIQKIGVEPTGCPKPPCFKAHVVTLSEKNLGKKISKNVVDVFNKEILPELNKTSKKEAAAVIAAAGVAGTVAIINKPEDFQDKVNFFTLAAGSGSRFRELAQTVGDYNKISLPFNIGKYDTPSKIHMLDFAMAMGKYFIGKEGVQPIVASQPSGSFGDIVQYYLEGNPIKDTMVCCGDNVFGDKASDMMTFFTKAINDPNKHVALVGVGRKPEEVANRFGVLQVEGSLKDGNDVLKLTGFSEKPPKEEAEKMAIDGVNIANTGMFYISKDAMEKLIDEIRGGVNNIKKSDSEPYDFANAVKYVHSKLPDWFGVESKEGADVKVVKKWEDVGEPKALYDFAEAVRHGEFLNNFSSAMADNIKNAFNKRVHVTDSIKYMNFSDSDNVDINNVINSPCVDGVNIVV